MFIGHFAVGFAAKRFAPRASLGLPIAGTMVFQTGMLAVGVGLYVSATRARDWIGRYAFAVYVVLLLGLYVSDRFSPPPDSMNEVAWVGAAAMVVMLPWAWWFDRHGDLRANVAAAARG
jgi:hypothetical protein